MSEILKRLGLDAAAKQSRPLLAEDYVFLPSDHESSRDLTLAHEEVFLDETPLAVVRQIHLQHPSRPHTSIRLHLALCWNGFRDGLTLVSRLSQSFQRQIPAEAVVNPTETYGIGDFGVAWPWSGKGDPDVIAFVRNNAVASFEAHDAAATVVPLARDIDGALRKLRTTDRYGEETAGVLDEVRKRAGKVPRLPAGGRLDLGVLTGGRDSLFFLTTSGSVNRFPDRAEAWYYRAGAAKGRQEITLFRVGKGILPVMERLSVEVD